MTRQRRGLGTHAISMFEIRPTSRPMGRTVSRRLVRRSRLRGARMVNADPIVGVSRSAPILGCSNRSLAGIWSVGPVGSCFSTPRRPRQSCFSFERAAGGFHSTSRTTMKFTPSFTYTAARLARHCVRQSGRTAFAQREERGGTTENNAARQERGARCDWDVESEPVRTPGVSALCAGCALTSSAVTIRTARQSATSPPTKPVGRPRFAGRWLRWRCRARRSTGCGACARSNGQPDRLVWWCVVL
jgi:hypothetical protein